MKRFLSNNLMRSFVFGVEDSVVSTVGLVSGIAAIGTGRNIILVTGCILVFVEAFSMAVGDMVSDNTVKEIRLHSETPLSKSFAPALVMFSSYLLSGFAVLAPYVFFIPTVALIISIGISLAVLFGLGALGGRLSGTSLLKNGLTMASVGGVAILIGMAAGFILQSLTGGVLL
jgi:VIT1/CCC1 family predicted Fe2+/Mn2+ transporter